jgi:hypothetical protein
MLFMKTYRRFYGTAGAVFIVAMLVGFHQFVANGRGAGGRIISPSIFRLDLIHGLAIASWYILFFIQSLLITVKSHRIHFKLGWAVVAIAPVIAITGTLVAIRSVQIAPPAAQFVGMQYSRFLLVMLTEIFFYAVFVTIGIFSRKKPRIHRIAMVLASLCLLAGATVRMPFLHPVFGSAGWVGIFGPVFCLGAILLLVHCAVTRTFDRWFAIGYSFWVIAFIACTKLALTGTWEAIARKILQL